MKRFFFTLMAVAVCIAASAQCSHQCSHHCNHACGAQSTCKDSLNIPVYIVDGVEVQEISSISPDDVLSVNVVTDQQKAREKAQQEGKVMIR